MSWLDGCHLADMIVGKPSCNLPAIDQNIEGSCEDQIYIVVFGTLLDERRSRTMAM